MATAAVVSASNGVTRQRGSNGRAGTYWHYFTRLPADAGPSLIYNVAGNTSRLRGALDVMVSSRVCEEPAPLLRIG